MRKRIGVLVVIGIAALAVFGWWADDAERDSDELSVDAALLPQALPDLDKYARAVGPYGWEFPADHGPHPNYQTEWWYYTGNLADASGRRFGYQFTIFRRAIAPSVYDSESEWRTNQLYMAHFTITDVAGERFFQHQRFSRGGAGLAGATATPQYRVWLEDWEVRALDDTATSMAIVAQTATVALDLELKQEKSPALHGDGGLSHKSDTVGNASYYYSLSRLRTSGTITLGDAEFEVSGTSWMDHEFSTSALGDRAQGWDWFGLHLDDQRDLMLGRIRLIDGGIEPAFGGLLVQPDGSTRYLDADSFTITVLETWISPHTGAEYPARWLLEVDTGEDKMLSMTLTPLLADQELIEGAIIYWEGAVQIEGDVTGYGYAELTGYAGTMKGRF